jgi:hypothetical protein
MTNSSRLRQAPVMSPRYISSCELTRSSARDGDRRSRQEETSMEMLKSAQGGRRRPLRVAVIALSSAAVGALAVGMT